MSTDATLELERSLAVRHGKVSPQGPLIIGGMDEVGRGALAGPVAVGLCLIDLNRTELLPGLRDSKRLTAKRRSALSLEIQQWSTVTVGWGSAQEIDEFGLSPVLALAAQRAWDQATKELSQPVTALIVDGNSRWIDHAPENLCEDLDTIPADLPVELKIKADTHCATVAAAAIQAKVTRDALMAALATQYPEYGWAGNKGYGSAGHRLALQEQGVTEHHRKTWKLLPDTPTGIQAPLL